jgi:hypothetical protein
MKVTNAKQLMEEYDSMSFNAVGFGSWLMERHFYSSVENGVVMYKIVGDKNYNHNHRHTMKELYELYMYENNKNYIHK